MLVKGTAFISRGKFVAKYHGEAAWEGFIKTLSQRVPFFNKPILASTSIPLENFLTFHSTVTNEFFPDDPRYDWNAGAESAQWTLTEGPYKAFLNSGDTHTFIQKAPAIWSTFFTAGQAEMRHTGNAYLMHISDLPYWHEYLDFTVAGYMERALELVSHRRVQSQRVAGGPGHTSYTYEYCLL